MNTDKTMENKKNNRKKKAAGITALLLALLLLMGGTFAWYTMASALNEFENEAQGAVLHDDFKEAKSGEIESEKNVYVENTGDEPLFIRVKLSEYFEIGGISQSSNPLAEKDDKTSWDVHTGAATAADGDFDEYWQWKMGGDSIEYEKAPAFKTGTVKRYDENGADTITTDPSKLGDTNGGNASTVITMNAYGALSPAEKQAYTGWILDPDDGYAYWSQKLADGETTGLLLDSVTRIKDPDGRYYYGINVEMESVDEDDLLAWLNGTETLDGKAIPEQASANARALLKSLSDEYQHYSAFTSEFNVDPEDYKDSDGYLGKAEQEAFEAAKLDAVKMAVAAKNVGETITIDGADFIVASKSGTQVELLLEEYTSRAVFGTNNNWADSSIKTTINEQSYIDANVPEILQNMMVEKANNLSDTSDKDKMYLMTKTTAEALAVVDATVLEADFDWWLITPVEDSNNRVYVVDGNDGSIDSEGAQVSAQKAIRPVFTVETN